MKKSDMFTLSGLILKKIAEVGIGTLDAFFPKNYPEARIWRKILGLDDTHEFSRKSFSSTLSRLKRQGLVKRRGSRKKSEWKITKQGLSFLKQKDKNVIPKSDGIQRIVIFDIAEKERWKRAVIRSRLVFLGYEQLQKSVWIGDIPLSEEFIQKIEDLKLQDCIHIFSVRDEGTLNNQ